MKKISDQIIEQNGRGKGTETAEETIQKILTT